MTKYFAIVSFLALGMSGGLALGMTGADELLKVKAELVRTKELLLNCQVANANSNLTTEKQKVIQEFKCKNDFDWDKLACKEVNDK